MIKLTQYEYDYGLPVFGSSGYFTEGETIDINENLVERIRVANLVVANVERQEQPCKVLWIFPSVKVTYKTTTEEHKCFSIKMSSGQTYYTVDLPIELQELCK